MLAKTGSAGNPVVIEHAQNTEMVALRIVVGCERKGMRSFEPAVVGGSSGCGGVKNSLQWCIF
jgi:acyl-CoA reductase-like NAD-dependent aldehyde dehydrogenase